MIDGSNTSPSATLPSNLSPPDQPDQNDAATEALHGDYGFMLRELRQWGLWQTGLGVFHLVGSAFLDAPWGILLLIVGLASFRFRSPAMFVVYPTTFLWAAFSNVTSGSTAWVGFGLVQVYFTYRIIRQFPRFLRAQRAVESVVPRDRARTVFPLAAAGLGTLALVGLVASLILIMAYAQQTVPQGLEMLVGIAVNLGVLGIALGLGSILSGFPHKSAAVYGLIASGLATVVWAILMVLSMTG